jgi:hypothetical protein
MKRLWKQTPNRGPRPTPTKKQDLVKGTRHSCKLHNFKLRGWGHAESYAIASNTAAGKEDRPATLDESTATYLDLAAATEAEVMEKRKVLENDRDVDPLDSLHHPTSAFGIGRRTNMV